MARKRVIPLAAERVRVDKSTDRRTVRVKKSVEQRTVRVDVPLASEEVVVERVPVDRFVDEPVPDRVEGDTLVISVLEEVPVTRLRVREEVRITKKRLTRRQPRLLALRSESVSIERDPPRTGGKR